MVFIFPPETWAALYNKHHHERGAFPDQNPFAGESTVWEFSPFDLYLGREHRTLQQLSVSRSLMRVPFIKKITPRALPKPKTRGSRLYFDNITTLAKPPRRRR
jgi:hypothetical protein